MAITVDVNGVPIIYPQIGDIGWGDEGSDFAVQTSAALGKLGLASGTSVDIAQTLDVTGNTTLDANLSVGGNASVTGNITVNGNSNLGNGTSDTTAITGILNVDSGVLYVDPTTNKVGINDATPSEALDVAGNLNVTGNITLGGSLVGTTGNFTDTTDATDADNAPLKTLGGMAVKKKLYVGTDLGVEGNANVTGDANVTGKALTGNGLVGAPTHSFINDSDSGLYRISENKIGFAANGIRQGEFGVGYGGFIGNVIQWITDKTQTSKSNTARAYVDIEKGTGVSWEILLTPKLLNSKIVILFRGAFQISLAAGIAGVRVLNKVNLGGTYSAIWKPEELNATAPFDPIDVGSGGTTAMYKNDYFVHAYHNPTYLIGDVLYYKFQFSPYNAGNVTNNTSRAGNNGETSVSIMEIAQ